MRAFGEARLAALKAGLSLTADQEKNWPAFEQAAREFAKLRLDRLSGVRTQSPADDPVERMRRRAAAMSDTGAALKKLADATDPLYKSLDESQKRRFSVLSRFARREFGRGEFRGRDDRDGDDRGGRRWGPRRMDDGPRDMEHSGEQRL
jgi:hypothetical protein